jgi:flagellar biosynthesis protein FlhG
MRSLPGGLRARVSPQAEAAPVKPRLWALASGKGGVGKSVIATSLALTASGRGCRCVLVDADLGAANLHTLLGIQKPHRTLSHFLNGEIPNLRDVLCPTLNSNLWLLSGASALVGMADARLAQQRRLLGGLRELGVQEIFLDLSAGSAARVLDLFLAAQQRILVVIPEPTSIENAYHFLKAAFYRSLRSVTRKRSIRTVLHEVIQAKGRQFLRSPLELIAAVSEIDAGAAEALRRRARTFAPTLLVNQAATVDHRRIGREIEVACREYLGTALRYVGTLERDESVRDAVKRRRPVLHAYPGCAFSKDVQRLGKRLLLPHGRPWPEVAREESYTRRRSLYGERPLAMHGLLSQKTPGILPEASRAHRPGLEAAGWPPPAEPSARPPVSLPSSGIAQPGVYLRRWRERLKLQLTELERRTRIRALESLENEDFDRLPPEPYVRGYVLQYARALGIPNAEQLAVSFLVRYRDALAKR